MKRLCWGRIVLFGLLIASLLPSPAEAQRWREAPRREAQRREEQKFEDRVARDFVGNPRLAEALRRAIQEAFNPIVERREGRGALPPYWVDPALRLAEALRLEGAINPIVERPLRLETAPAQSQAWKAAWIREFDVHAQQSTVDAAIREAADLVEKGRWEAAGDLADRTLAGISAYPEVNTAPLLPFARLKRADEAIGRVESLLRSDAAPDLDADTANSLSPSLRAAYHSYHNLTTLSKKAECRWESRVPDLGEMIEALSSLRSSPDTRAIAEGLARELAVKAFFSGHPAEADLLLFIAHEGRDEAPTGKDRTDADALLRDVQAVILGEGKVETWAAVQVLRPRPDESNHPIRGPPAMLPADEIHGYRPPVAEQATKRLSPVEPLIPFVAQRRQRAEQATKQERDGQETERRAVLAYVRDYKPYSYINGLGIGTDDDKKRRVILNNLGDPIAEVEKALGRKLKGDERKLAQQFLNSNIDPKTIAVYFQSKAFRGE